MVQKSTNVTPVGTSSHARIRTPDSTVWRSTKARDLVSSVRFSWDKYQKLYFVEFLETVGLGFKNADITPLLVQLNLDGYEDIDNDYGENVHDLIEEKVRRKIKNTADELGTERLKKASFGPKIVEPTQIQEPVAVSKDMASSKPETLKPKTKAPARVARSSFEIRGEDHKSTDKTSEKGESARCDTTAQGTLPPQQSHPFLKMPKAPITLNSLSSSSTSNATSSSSSTFGRDINCGKPVPTFSFQGLQSPSSGRSTPQRSIKSEYSDYSSPSFEFVDPVASEKSTPSSVHPNEADDLSSAKRSRAKRSIGRLVSLLKRAESALDEVEIAFDDLPQMEGGSELAGTIRRLRSEFDDVQVDAEEVEDFAATNLKS
ncbi:uncharacterized protein F4807DRAFT_444212 [Annulohypoxylon truncatum]|uniref:uncharacterized protein n=1 Tax=Annulohypoxylon truncatum TaxID=327061 RepID=UPI002008C710|nr:uncharacterized protein F4807DRAFT_444212 [Annulohypoxylon truncatum]KAI1205168.1 hypothetical protein F4807DRAFT_444212 [Annulohypoxylon truncatum]